MKFPSPEFDDTVAALCHGTVSDQALAELHELLRTDADAQDEYLWSVEIHGELASGMLDFGRASEFEETDDRLKSITASLGVATNAGRWRYQSLAMVAALLVLIALSGGLWLRHASRTSPVEPEVVARFADLRDSRWMTPTTQISSGDAVRNGQRIELSSGSAEVQFNSGASLNMVGPTILEPLSDNSAFLVLGQARLVAETPESKGFTLVTRTSRFVDIGTAFTATVAPDGLSRLNVSEGEVDVVLEGSELTPRLRAGETLYVEPGERQVMTRIEQGDGTAVFRFPTIHPPSSEDYADQASGHATIQVSRGQLKSRAGRSGPVAVLLDGVGQSHQDAPRESAFFEDLSTGSFLVDLGQVISITSINSYSWHQHDTNESHRQRARQEFTLYGYSDDPLPDLTRGPAETGWTRIARVNSDQFFGVAELRDRPAQQACSITAAQGEIGRFRYLLWEVHRNTLFGELDVFGSPNLSGKITAP